MARPRKLTSKEVALIEKSARLMAEAAGWTKWDTATSVCHTLSGNEPDDERAYWIGMATIAFNTLQPLMKEPR